MPFCTRTFSAKGRPSFNNRKTKTIPLTVKKIGAVIPRMKLQVENNQESGLRYCSASKVSMKWPWSIIIIA